MKPGIVCLLDYISPNLLGAGLHKRIQGTLPDSDLGVGGGLYFWAIQRLRLGTGLQISQFCEGFPVSDESKAGMDEKNRDVI